MAENKVSIIIHLALLLCAGTLVYANSLHGAFVWDDQQFVVRNDRIKEWGKAASIFKGNSFTGGDFASDVYRPLQEFSYTVDYSLGKLRVQGYHGANILLHCLVAACLYWMVLTFYGDRLRAFLAGVLFVVSPLHTEAVAYISGRQEMLSALCMLVCILLYVRHIRSQSLLGGAGMAASFVAALLSKENALMLPFLLLWYHVVFAQKIRKRAFFILASIAGAYIVLRFPVLGHLYPGSQPLFARVPGFFVAISAYARLLLFPIGLRPEYGQLLFSWENHRVWCGVAIVACLVFLALAQRKRRAWLVFSIGWFFISLAPSTGVYPANSSFMFEHWLYFPSIGFFLAASTILASWYRDRQRRPWAMFLIVGLVAGYSALTVYQNRFWRDPVALFKRGLVFAPLSARFHYNLGTALSEYNQHREAIKEYALALALEPAMAKAHYNMGTEYETLADYASAIAEYKKAIALKPGLAQAYNNLCGCYILLGKYKDAVDACKKAIARSGGMASAYYNLSNAQYVLGDMQGAIQAGRKAIEIDRKHVQAYNNLASMYAGQGNIDQALRLWNAAVVADPSFATAHFNLAVFYLQKKEYALAIKHCDKVVELGNTVDPALLELLRPFRGKQEFSMHRP